MPNGTDYEAGDASLPKLGYSRGFWNSHDLTFHFNISFNCYRKISAESPVPYTGEQFVLSFIWVASCSEWWFSLNYIMLTASDLGHYVTYIFTLKGNFETRDPHQDWITKTGNHSPLKTARKLDKMYWPTVTSHWITHNEWWWPLERGANESSLYSCSRSLTRKSLEGTTQKGAPNEYDISMAGEGIAWAPERSKQVGFRAECSGGENRTKMQLHGLQKGLWLRADEHSTGQEAPEKAGASLDRAHGSCDRQPGWETSLVTGLQSWNFHFKSRVLCQAQNNIPNAGFPGPLWTRLKRKT